MTLDGTQIAVVNFPNPLGRYEVSINGYTGTLCNNETNQFTTKLNFTYDEDVSVECRDNTGISVPVPLQTAGEMLRFHAF